jgi:hypothetical protein
MSTASAAARMALNSTVTRCLGNALFRTPVSDEAEIDRITGPGVTQVMDAAEALVAAAVAEALAVQAAEHTVKSAAAETAQTLEGTR